MYLRRSILFILLFASLRVMGGGPFEPLSVPELPNAGSGTENERLVSSGLALLLGPFGAHRIYLGTTPKVAIIYGVTFGGFCILVLLDLVHLVFSKDLKSYRNNDRVLMWGKPKEPITPQ